MTPQHRFFLFRILVFEDGLVHEVVFTTCHEELALLGIYCALDVARISDDCLAAG